MRSRRCSVMKMYCAMNNMPQRSLRKKALGFSLLELLVVLTILIALGGIVVSTLPGVLHQTQVATAAASIPEINKSIRRHAMLSQGEIGNRFDALVVGSAALDGDIAPYVGGRENFQAIALSDGQVQALRQIGVTELIPAIGETSSATYGSHDQSPVPIGSDSKVCQLSPSFVTNVLQVDWNIEPNEGASYLVFGLGEQCTLVGGGADATFPESFVHFSDDRLESPAKMYGRYLLIIELRPTSETQFVARFVSAAIPGIKGAQNVSKVLEGYYSSK